MRARRQAPRAALRRRADGELPFLEGTASAGNGLLLDTCVYIDQMQGRLSQPTEALLGTRTINHSTVAVQELMHTVGVRDPDDPRTETVIASIGAVIEAMPSHRMFTPDAEVLAGAAVYAGMLCRTQGYLRDDRMGALHDCVLFLQALKLGLGVLTRDVRDFDFLLQMRPDGRVLFYRIEDRRR